MIDSDADFLTLLRESHDDVTNAQMATDYEWHKRAIQVKQFIQRRAKRNGFQWHECQECGRPIDETAQVCEGCK